MTSCRNYVHYTEYEELKQSLSLMMKNEKIVPFFDKWQISLLQKRTDVNEEQFADNIIIYTYCK